MVRDVDVLIAFAEGDNQLSQNNELGWVSQFKKFLELMLTQVLGEKPKIVLASDKDITSRDIANAHTLVTILSKDFIQSIRCSEITDSFVGAETNGHQPRKLFKVFKAPLNVQDQPVQLRELIGYEMYQLDPDSGEIREYTDYFSTDAERQYWMKMVDLTYDIFEALRGQQNQGVKNHVSFHKRKTIYLAETGHDLSVQRNIIKRELQRHGYHILPNQTLPDTLTQLERVVKRDLEDCSLSIHLVGSAYGVVPEGSDRSIVDIQHSLAAEKTVASIGTAQGFSRLIWISPNLTHAGEKQKSFIENIKRDVEAQEGAEILQTSLEDFKNIMREELLDARDKNKLGDTEGRAIYFMHDRLDRQAVRPFIEVLQNSGFKVLTPEFEGELLTLRQKHIENLRNLDAAIIYQGQVNEQWVRMKALDLLKAPGFGRKKPIVAKAILTTPGSAININDFKKQNLRVIEGDERHTLESLKSFIQEFNP